MVNNVGLHYFRSLAETCTIALFTNDTTNSLCLVNINKYCPTTIYCLFSLERNSHSEIPSSKKLRYSKFFCSNQAIVAQYQGLLWHIAEYLFFSFEPRFWVYLETVRILSSLCSLDSSFICFTLVLVFQVHFRLNNKC